LACSFSGFFASVSVPPAVSAFFSGKAFHKNVCFSTPEKVRHSAFFVSKAGWLFQCFYRQFLSPRISIPSSPVESPLAASASTAAWSAAAAPAPVGLRPGFTDVDCPIHDIRTVQRCYGFIRVFVIDHFHKTEPLGPACCRIGDDFDRLYFSQGSKDVPERIFCDIVRQIADIELLRHFLPLRVL
jgi:hypothetical protein